MSDRAGIPFNFGINADKTTVTNGYIDPISYGADPTGKRDSTPAILQAVKAALASGITLNTGAGAASRYLTLGVHVRTGIYLLNTPCDLSTVLIGNNSWTANAIRGFQFICDPGVIFLQGAGIASGTVFNIDVNNGQLLNSQILLGHLIGRFAAGGSAAWLIKIRNFSNGRLEIEESNGSDKDGIWFDSRTAAYGTFNNTIRLGDIQKSKNNGISIDSTARGNALGFQGNHVQVGECYGHAANGVTIDGAYGTNGNTRWNEIRLGYLEFNAASGIFDNNGGNRYIMNAGSNTVCDYYLAAGAKGQPYIRGALSSPTPFLLNGGTADIVNHPIG